MIENRGWAKDTQMKFYCVTGLIGGFFLNGTEVLWPLFYISIGYVITKATRRLPESLAILIIWLYNLAVLFSIYLLPYPQINELFPFMRTITFGYVGFSRWSIYYKLAMLRLISFGIDFQQAYRKNQRPSVTPLTTATSNQTSTGPASISRYELADLKQFNFVSLIGYTFYLPLVIAGPIAPFSQFARDVEQRQTQVPLRSILWMFVQVTVYTIAMEIWLHYIYVYSWNHYGKWSDFTPSMLSMICFWTLHHMFLKFTVIWRSFRALALLDGISVVRQKFTFRTSSTFFRSHTQYGEHEMRSRVVLVQPRISACSLVFLLIWLDQNFIFCAQTYLLSLVTLARLSPRQPPPLTK
jgi:protein-cysteine N-palmitoyltransferase HHAT